MANRNTLQGTKEMDQQKAAEMRRLLASEGEKAVAQRYGEQALHTEEYREAQRQHQQRRATERKAVREELERQEEAERQQAQREEQARHDAQARRDDQARQAQEAQRQAQQRQQDQRRDQIDGEHRISEQERRDQQRDERGDVPGRDPAQPGRGSDGGREESGAPKSERPSDVFSARVKAAQERQREQERDGRGR